MNEHNNDNDGDDKDYDDDDYENSGLILERAREPDALYFALGLSCFASSEPGRLSLIGIDSKRSS